MVYRINIPRHILDVYNSIGQDAVTGGYEGCYGEIQQGSTQSLMVKLVELGLVIPGSTVMIELGSGLGKPSLHYSALFNSLCIGVELQEELYRLSINNMKKVYINAAKKNFPLPPASFINESIFNIKTLNGFNLVYSFDSLFEPELVEKITSLLKYSATIDILVSYRSQREWAEYGLAVTKLASIQMTMVVSNEKRTCSIFRLGRVSVVSAATKLNDIDPLFRSVFQSYRNGLLTSQNKEMNAGQLCGALKTRTSQQQP